MHDPSPLTERISLLPVNSFNKDRHKEWQPNCFIHPPRIFYCNITELAVEENVHKFRVAMVAT
jgi:hypothetical protein